VPRSSPDGDLARRPGGPIEAVKETAATLKTVRAAEGGDRGELVGALATEVVAEAGQRKNPLGGFKPTGGATPASRSSASSARSTASSGEGVAGGRRRAAPVAARPAQEAANAAKEGGFLGFHAERVSEGEQKMLDSLRDTLSEG
jgi:hypothetical protein